LKKYNSYNFIFQILSKDTLRLYLIQANNKHIENFFGFIKIDKNTIIELLNKIFGSFYTDLLPHFDDKESLVKCSSLNLFIWCILTNRTQIGKIFWRIGTVYKLEFIYDRKEINLNFSILLVAFSECIDCNWNFKILL